MEKVFNCNGTPVLANFEIPDARIYGGATWYDKPVWIINPPEPYMIESVVHSCQIIEAARNIEDIECAQRLNLYGGMNIPIPDPVWPSKFNIMPADAWVQAGQENDAFVTHSDATHRRLIAYVASPQKSQKSVRQQTLYQHALDILTAIARGWITL